MKSLLALWLAVAITAGLCYGVHTLAADKPAVQTTTGAAWAAATADTPTPAPTAGKRLTWKERRALGVTIRNVRRVMKDLKTEGVLSPDSDIAAIQVLDRLTVENPQAFKAVGDIDWDRLLEFLERLIELLLKILPIFLG